MFGTRRDPATGLQQNQVRAHGSAVHVRWLFVLLLAAIAIVSVAGIVSAAAMGQTPVAIAIGIVALAFFSRVGC